MSAPGDSFDPSRLPLGQAFMKARSKLVLNQTDFAHLAGIHHSMLSRIEHGMRKPTAPVLGKLLTAIKILDPDYNEAEWARLLRETIGAELVSGDGEVRIDIPVGGQSSQVHAGAKPYFREASRGYLGYRLIPDSVLSVENLIEALNEVWVRAGEPSVRTMEARLRRRSSTYGPSPSKSTLHSMMSAKTLPKLENVRAFLRACGVEWGWDWEEVWSRLALLERQKKRTA
ncbi:helix-turn-helix transcriptional regulator [Streptomyces sp. NPDC002766]|uniref:helix-turn-helix domain-containing protein n=1 Tax=Streptomyces sp. NPDC002766 TaxID=3154429 RepID=UPI0033205127